MVFTDDFSRKSWAFFMKAKNGTFEKFKNLKNNIEDGENKIKMLRIDRGGEFLSNLINSFCEQNGIKRQLATIETPHQNGIVEWKNRTILERAKNMAMESYCLAYLWIEVVNTSTYLTNRNPIHSNGGLSPEHVYNGT
jgi:transposase InsO family protein